MFELIMKAFESNAVIASIVSAIIAAFPIIVAKLYKSRKYIWDAIEIIDAMKESSEFLLAIVDAADPNSDGGTKYTKAEIAKIKKEGQEAKDAIEKSPLNDLLKKFKKKKVVK